MNKPWKVVLAFAGIFLAGIVVGGLVTLRVVKHYAQQRLPAPDQFGPQLMRRFATQLDLTPEQKEKIKPIVMQGADELRQLRRSTEGTTRAVIERMQGEIAAVLTPEQKTKFDDLISQQRERMKRFGEERLRRFRDKDNPLPPPK